MKRENRNNYLMKNTIIFAIGNFGSKLITFFLVPLYTNILTVPEYGKIDLINVISTVIIPLVTLNISEAILRYSMEKDIDKDKVLNVGIAILIIASLIGIISYPLIFMFFSSLTESILLVFFTLTAMSSHIFLYSLRGREKLVEYAVISIIQTFLIAFFNICFLVILKAGINGYILTYIISNLLTSTICLIKLDVIKVLKNFTFDKKIAKEMIKYSVILIPNSLMWWIMNSLDRIMITSMINLDANGIYAVSYKIPTIVVTITSIFNQAWMFSAVKEKESHDKTEYTNSIYSALFYTIVTISIGLLLILKPLLSIYVGSEFFIAWEYTPVLIIGTVFLTLGTFISNEYTAHKDSLGFLKSSSIGAIANLILNFAFIPIIGIQGAAIATCISYITVYTYRIIDTRKYLKIKVLDLKKVICIILLLLSALFVYIDNNYSYILNTLIFILEVIITKDFWKKIFFVIKHKIIKVLKLN